MMSDLHPVGRCLDGGGAGGERLLDGEQPFAAAEQESLHPRQFAALQGRHHALERPQEELPPPGEPGREPVSDRGDIIIRYCHIEHQGNQMIETL